MAPSSVSPTPATSAAAAIDRVQPPDKVVSGRLSHSTTGITSQLIASQALAAATAETVAHTNQYQGAQRSTDAKASGWQYPARRKIHRARPARNGASLECAPWRVTAAHSR